MCPVSLLSKLDIEQKYSKQNNLNNFYQESEENSDMSQPNQQ